MSRKAVSGIMLTLLLISMLALAFNIQPAEAVVDGEITDIRFPGGTDYYQGQIMDIWVDVYNPTSETLHYLVAVNIYDPYMSEPPIWDSHVVGQDKDKWVSGHTYDWLGPFTWIIPTDAPTGTYHVLAGLRMYPWDPELDYRGLDWCPPEETFTVLQASLDGEITDRVVLTPEVVAGNQLRVQVTVENIGNIRAEYNVYIGNIWDSEGHSAGNAYSESHQIIQLDPGASQTLTLVWTTPSTMEPGDYTGDLWLQMARPGGGWEKSKQYPHAISFTIANEQYYVIFQQSGCGGTPHVTVDGQSHTLPYSTWMDSGSSHSFIYESPVTEGQTQWVLTSTSHSSPVKITGPTTITGYYSLSEQIELFYDDGTAEGQYATSTLPHYKAVRFHTPAADAYKLVSARYYVFLVERERASFDLQIRDSSALLVYSRRVDLGGPPGGYEGWITCDLSSEGIYVQGNFYVAMKYLNVGGPRLGADYNNPDGESGEGSSFPSEPNITSLDWMIRAVLGENERPTAHIESIHPNPANKGENVYFSGYGSDPDGSIVGWRWESSIDGFLSDSSSFSTSSLSVGTHTIYFYVEDDAGASSLPDTETLIIECTSLYVRLVSSDDDYHIVDVYVDGEYWTSIGCNPRQTTYSPDKEVTPNSHHSIEIRWHDDDCGGRNYIKRRSNVYIVEGHRVEFEFNIVMPFWVPTDSIINPWTVIDTTLAESGDHSYFHVATDGLPDWFQLESQLASEFETIYNIEKQKFGLPPDEDSDDHVYILIYDTFGVSGRPSFFDPRSEEKNEAEIIHLAWAGAHSGNLQIGVFSLAHEFNHMIIYNYENKILGSIDEERWILEGMAEYARYVVCGSDAIYPNPSDPTELDGYIAAFLNLETHGTTRLIYNDVSIENEHRYAASWLFMQYLAEKYGHECVKDIFQDPDNGKQSVEDHLPVGTTFGDVFGNWVIANYVDLETGPYSYEQDLEIQGVISENTISHFLHGDEIVQEQGHEVEEWSADYIWFNTSETHLEVSFYGNLGVDFEVAVLLIKGDFSSCQIITMKMFLNTGSVTVGPPFSDDANSYSQIVLMTKRYADLFLGDASYIYRAEAYTPSALKVEAQSPVNILVTAPDGLCVGYDPETGSVVNEIPGASYSGPGSDPQVISIPDPLPGTYLVDAFGTGTGSYTIFIETLTSNGSIIDAETWDGTALPDEQYTETALLNADGHLKPYDIAVSDIMLSKTVIGKGYCMNITVTIENCGDYTESFNVSVFYDDTIITLPDGKNHTTTTLTSGDSTTLTFIWNTTGVAKGNYTITAKATILPGETDTLDNIIIDGIITVTIPGDVDGDFDVDLYDAVAVCAKYGFKKGHPEYDPNCDINDNDQIFLYDAVIVGAHYGQKHP